MLLALLSAEGMRRTHACHSIASSAQVARASCVWHACSLPGSMCRYHLMRLGGHACSTLFDTMAMQSVGMGCDCIYDAAKTVEDAPAARMWGLYLNALR